MNAIQTTHHASISTIGTPGPFPHIEQKTFSLPPNDLQNAIFSHTAGQAITQGAGGMLGKATTDMRKQTVQVATPQFIMRSTHAGLSASDQQKKNCLNADYQVGSQLVKSGPSRATGISTISSGVRDVSTNGTSFLSGSGKMSQPYQAQIKAPNGFSLMELNALQGS